MTFKFVDPEPYNQYPVRYVGNCCVSAPTGIDVIKDAISKLLTIHLESDWTVGYALISATTITEEKPLKIGKKYIERNLVIAPFPSL